MNLKGEIESIAKELGEYAASEEARGTLYVSGKIADLRAYLKGLWSKPIALSVAVIALLLGLLIGWSCNESRHASDAPHATVEAVR